MQAPTYVVPSCCGSKITNLIPILCHRIGEVRPIRPRLREITTLHQPSVASPHPQLIGLERLNRESLPIIPIQLIRAHWGGCAVSRKSRPSVIQHEERRVIGTREPALRQIKISVATLSVPSRFSSSGPTRSVTGIHLFSSCSQR